MLRAAMTKLAADVGQRIIQLREAAGYSQRELAQLVGTTHGTLGSLERGQTASADMELLDRLAHVLNVEPADLFNFPWSTEGVPWRHIARELVRMTPSVELTKLVNRIERFSTVRLTELVDQAIPTARRYR